MAFVSEVRLTHENLTLVPTMEAVPDATIRYEYELREGGSTMYFVSVFGDGREAIEEAVEDDHTVGEWIRVAVFNDRTVYRVTCATDLALVPAHCAERGLFVLRIRSDDGGWLVRVHVKDRSLLTKFLQYYRDNDVTFRMDLLYESTAQDAEPYFLTKQQHEILSVAYYGGYFDVPRRLTQDDLAERLDVSTSAVSQRLRRAISAVLAVTIEDRPTSDQ